ncbi:hypothetical protein BW686_07405 [Pseudomonas syringae]|uniref:Uncharacterized protein n=1 Tax=Pseudomonas syringae TaxID=317 RepID=A0A244EV54_PSESX|nr:hypothetical protein BW686_07385 [Pseudomonas syringae]OUM07852.1 hypothetical protein BW686_07405 [Pseudomonas syringae]
MEDQKWLIHILQLRLAYWAPLCFHTLYFPPSKVKKYHVRFRHSLALIRLLCSAGMSMSSMISNIQSSAYLTMLLLLAFKSVP